jgi:Ca-activated chloride channel homolog
MSPISELRSQTTRRSSRAGSGSLWPSTLRLMWYTLAVSLLATFVSVPVYAGEGSVTLRVEARPIADPINVFVTVTNGDGAPVGGLTAADFTVLVDGVEVVSPAFALSPIQDADRQVSIIFVMDYSGSTNDVRDVMEASVVDFIETMAIGDYAAIIKFNGDLGAQVLAPGFVQITGDAVRQSLKEAVTIGYVGRGSPVYDAVKLAIDQFNDNSTQLPAGPRAVVLISDGRDNSSAISPADLTAQANDSEVSIFSVGVGTINFAAMTELAFRTGGQFYEAQDGQAITDAYSAISTTLRNEYLLTFASDITDCNVHTVEVRVKDLHPATSTFTRCTVPGSSTPPPEGNVGGTTPPPPSAPSNGGGGGSVGLLELLAGVSLLALRRRLLKA